MLNTPSAPLPVPSSFAGRSTPVGPFPVPVTGANAGSDLAWRWLTATLDELDYGIVLLVDGARILHINDVARLELDDCHPLKLEDGELRARAARDVASLQDAVNDAAQRGFRRLLTLGKEPERASVSVVPLETNGSGRRAVLLLLGKRAVCESLSVHGFARSHGLTGAETRVLLELCNGAPPAKVASEFGVAISTVRSQIGSMRQKTGSSSIRALVRQIAVLPPVKGVLRAASGSGRGNDRWLPDAC